MPKKSSSSNHSNGQSVRTTISGHPAIDLVAAIFRSYGRYSVTSENLEDICEAWARHLLIGEPPPGIPLADEATSQDRAWEEARRFFTELRRNEGKLVEERINSFREMLWLFMDGIRNSFIQDQTADKEVAIQLDKLKRALDSESIETLRREVVGSVSVIGRTLEQRNQRQERQMRQLGAQLKSLRDELVRVKQEMGLDSLTRLYNRASFDEMFERTLGLNQWSGQTACLLMVDVDGFKKINDNYGHPTGDAALVELAHVMLRSFPRKDDFVSRYAGDEFAIILQNTSSKEGMVLAERLMKAVRAITIKSTDQEINFTVSIGMAELKSGDTPDTWLRRTDAALYNAKQTGRDRVVLQKDVE